MNIVQAMTDPALFADQFAGESWQNWRTLLAGFYGLPLDDDQAESWTEMTGLEKPPEAEHDELWLVIGRRGGKSQIAALLAVYTACFDDYKDRLAAGEVATVLVLAADRKQARAVFRYTQGLLNANPMLKRMIVREDRESIELNNRTVIEIGTASFRSVRGYTLAAVIADEVAYWRSDDSANPDTEILNALRPALATLDGKLIALSSPYARRGALWESYRRYYGRESAVLVAQAPSRTMNPKLPQKVIDEAVERDSVAADAEYFAKFRNDISAFITRDLIDNNVRSKPLIIPATYSARYVGFVDVAGGGADEFTLAIAFKEGNRAIIAGVWAQNGDPAAITAQYAAILKLYGINTITGDRYAAQWPVNEFMRHGINLKPSELNRSEIYLEFLPLLQTGAVELPPDEKALSQFVMLERRTSRSGRDTIDHAPGPGSHDDRCNAIAGAAVALSAPEMPINCKITYVY